MDTENTANCYKSTMTLKEPKKKRRVRLRPSKPLPLNIGDDGQLTVYTGHLSSLGVCVADPEGIHALHTNGFFGKGSLSRSYPCFEKTKRGLPPVVRHRQWARRQEWRRQVEVLDARARDGDSNEEEWENIGRLDSEERIEVEKKDSEKLGDPQRVALGAKAVTTGDNLSKRDEKVAENVETGECFVPPEKRFKYASSEPSGTPGGTGDKGSEDRQDSEKNRGDCSGIVVLDVEDQKIHSDSVRSENIGENSQKFHETDIKSLNIKTGEIVLDSDGEEDEIREISSTETKKFAGENSRGDMDVVVLLKDEEMSVDSEENDRTKTDNEEINDDDDVQMLERELIVLPDSDSDTENYLSKVKPTIEKEGFPVRETLYLTFEETFFLMFGLGCLQVIDYDGNLLNILEAWNHFCSRQKDFVQRYVVYHYFRSHGWVVKPGLKYGGDFLLYKQGPPFYHASYIVIVEVVDADTLLRDKTKTTRKMTWKKLFGLDRLSETASKEILFAQVLWPSSIPRNEIPSSPDLLAEFTVVEMLCRRWIPKHKREEINLEDDAEETK